MTRMPSYPPRNRASSSGGMPPPPGGANGEPSRLLLPTSSPADAPTSAANPQNRTAHPWLATREGKAGSRRTCHSAIRFHKHSLRKNMRRQIPEGFKEGDPLLALRLDPPQRKGSSCPGQQPKYGQGARCHLRIAPTSLYPGLRTALRGGPSAHNIHPFSLFLRALLSSQP